ncbi:hypothetical protein [Mycoplasma parvum]|uniref:DUF418 domain-containing protein n=1 Tax=Mycoplasma parvum str. Indiana TaxID=1403316 RepID=U5NFZ3_9MOLU|nr:hypothetical protein [Mycoplasma parvum]AGX89173.1 hypothetical protein PRV_02175 [Mycoplasma parvum str. Indiana]
MYWFFRIFGYSPESWADWQVIFMITLCIILYVWFVIEVVRSKKGFGYREFARWAISFVKKEQKIAPNKNGKNN